MAGGDMGLGSNHYQIIRLHYTDEHFSSNYFNFS